MDKKKGKASSLNNMMEFFKGDKGKKIIVFAGIAGMVLILLSAVLPRSPSKTQTTTESTNAQYEAKLEERLTNIVSNISGAGKTKVLVTLENGVENIYASDYKKNSDKTEEYDSGITEKTQETTDSEENIVMVEGSDGRKQALITTQIEPQIKGVVIVCDGGESASVKQRIIEAVTTALDISSEKVCVIKSI